MPNKKSAAKELRKSVKRNTANKKMSLKMKSQLKNNLKQLAAGDQKVKNDYLTTIQMIDKAAKKGIIKKNSAARKKSRLMKKINGLK